MVDCWPSAEINRSPRVFSVTRNCLSGRIAIEKISSSSPSTTGTAVNECFSLATTPAGNWIGVRVLNTPLGIESLCSTMNTANVLI